MPGEKGKREHHPGRRTTLHCFKKKGKGKKTTNTGGGKRKPGGGNEHLCRRRKGGGARPGKKRKVRPKKGVAPIRDLGSGDGKKKTETRRWPQEGKSAQKRKKAGFPPLTMSERREKKKGNEAVPFP